MISRLRNLFVKRRKLKKRTSRVTRYPGVYIEELSSAMRTIQGVDTAITAFVGWAPQGPTDQALRVRSVSQYEQYFGGLDQRSLLGYAVLHFFANGGSDAYIIRLADDDADATPINPNEAAFESRLDPATKDGGVYLLDATDGFNILCVPGETTEALVASLQTFCHHRRAFLIVDSPKGGSPSDMQSGPSPILTGPDASNSALYYPWVEAADPLDGHLPRAFPPCGFLAGIYARTDVTRGVWKAPAGLQATVTGAAGTEVTLTDQDNDVLNPRGINCIRAFPSRGMLVWGSRTLQGAEGSGSEWKYVPVRRLALFIEESLMRGTQWVVFETNDEPLWSKIRSSVEAFMHDLFRQGAFQGSTARKAYFVRCDGSTTTAADISSGVVNIHVGFAPLKPAEFVVIRIQQKAGQT